jgi:hypothetical protein
MTELMNSPEKVAMIRDVAGRHPHLRAFVETGTACGDLPFGTYDLFDRVVTIEMDEHLFNTSVARLGPFDHVQVVLGDAAEWIDAVLGDLDEPCLIWLDAHEIADDGHSSMRAEFSAIAASPHRHVVLVDDARLCKGRKGWMSLESIEKWATATGYDHQGINDDVVWLVG